MASEATKMATRGNMHMGTRVIEVTEFNSEVSLDIRGHLEANRTSEAMVASKQPQRTYDLRFDISILDYPGILAHIASNSHFGGL